VEQWLWEIQGGMGWDGSMKSIYGVIGIDFWFLWCYISYAKTGRWLVAVEVLDAI
jgi:hypothetical protein